MCLCAQPGWLEDAEGSKGCFKLTGTRRWIQPAVLPCSSDSWPRENTGPLLSMTPSLQEQNLSSGACFVALQWFQKIGMWDQKREEKREGEKERNKGRLEFKEDLVPTLMTI